MKTFIPLNRIVFFCLMVTGCFLHISGQGIRDTSPAYVQPDSLHKFPALSSPYNKIENTQFNAGLITDPLQLVQGHSASLFTSRAGNDPNQAFDMRIRGIKSFDITEPLVLVDGMPVYSLEAIHPADIASVEVLTDAPSLAQWGMRGSNGILSIQTNKGSAGNMKVQYRVVRSSEKLVRKPDLLRAREYVQFGGSDLGGSTDWWDLVTQKALSHTHHLSLSGGTKTSTYYASLNYDQVNGIVVKSGFDRLTGRLSFQQKALDDRLTLHAGLASTARNASPTPLVALWHATSYNPTAPVYSNASIYDKWGGFFEVPNLFDNYNPLSILLQNDFSKRHNNLSIQIEADYKILKSLSGHLMFGKQTEAETQANYFASTSLYVGSFYKGLAQQTYINIANQYARGGLNWNKKIKDIKLKASIAYHFQDIDEQYLSVNGGGFLTDAFGVNNMAAAQNFSKGEGEISSSKQVHQLSRYTADISINLLDKYQLSSRVSREGSSRLGINNKWGTFYGIQASARLRQDLRVRANMSKTGNLPSKGALSQGIFQPQGQFYYNGAFVDYFGKRQNANPNLSHEETSEWSLGIDYTYLNNRLHGSIDYYKSYSRNLIQQVWDYDSPNLGQFTYMNSGAINSSGWKLVAGYQLFRQADFRWEIGVNTSFYGKSILKSYDFGDDATHRYIGILGGTCAFPVFRLEEGNALGDIWGYQISQGRAVDENNNWNFVDQDGDGRRTQSGDYVSIGNGMPKASFGISQQLSWKKLNIDLLMRGVLGHDVINHIKSFHSVRTIMYGYNVNREAITELSRLQDFADFNSRDVEGASFLRLSNIRISYDLAFQKLKGFDNIQVFFTAQNLFTISSYSGIDPELRLEDVDSRTPSSAQGYYGQVLGDLGDPLVMGMDRRNAYPLSRIFVLGIELNL